MSGQWQRGFSLLELLVTLFVIVLVTSLVTLNVGTGGADYRLQHLVENVADTANYALDEAQFAGWDYGLLITRQDRDGEPYYRLRWLERGPERWRSPLSGKEVFADVDLDAGVELELTLDGALQDEQLFYPRVDAPAPQVVLYASGETLPGALDLLDENGSLLWRLEWDLLGNFRALRQGLAEDELP